MDTPIDYYEHFVENRKEVFEEISNLFTSEERKEVDGKRLNRMTMVFISNTADITVIPKIWGKDVTVSIFPKILEDLRINVIEKTGFDFNICLANYYSTGKRSIGFHSDNEEKGSISCIASISLGAERAFDFRKKENKEIVKRIVLSDGSLLVMKDGCQENFEHQLPVDKNCKEPRLNLTFRLFDSNRYSR